MNEPVLVLSQVSKLFGKFKAVEDLSLEVPKGSVYGFLGPNGAGKTTTIRMILSIFEPTSGSVRILGTDSALKVRDRIGYLPEEKGLYKKMKAWSIVAYFGALKGMRLKDAKEKAHELLDRYGLKDFANHKCEALSKGMQQKVQVLASVVHDPEFVILDEPFSGLDPVNQQVMEDLIQDLKAKGSTIIFSTHVMQHAERICDRILLIAQGRKIFDGTIAEAKRAIPRRVLIETDDNIAPLRNTKVFSSAKQAEGMGGKNVWEVQLKEEGDAQEILKACFDHGIKLKSFDRNDPSLHDVFVHLVGPEAKEATLR